MIAAGRPAPAQTPTSCLARQPILAKDEKVIGYELFFRESAEDNRFTSDGDRATGSTIDTLNVVGLDAVCDGRLAFINCNQQMLLKEYFYLLPPEKVVVEIQENVSCDDAVISACQRLKHKRYKIALDNFATGDTREAVVLYADFIKVNIQKDPQQNAVLATKYARPQCQMLAQKVETREQSIAAGKDGFTLFQGYFFRRPERMRARHISANQAGYLRLLQAISAPELDLVSVEELIKHDASLCYRLLRYLNSPLLGISSPVHSVRHAMDLLGERELTRWIRMATTLVLGQDKCSDLVLSSLVRARFCELIAPKIDPGKSDLFLLGMLSLMDSILEVPMGFVLEGLAVDENMKAELMGVKTGKNTPLALIYQLMQAQEAGAWEQVTAHAKKLNLSLAFVNKSYNDAMTWAHKMTADASDGTHPK
jgi:EAL and modified HD-GYP domain-containing signal transduction protein